MKSQLNYSGISICDSNWYCKVPKPPDVDSLIRYLNLEIEPKNIEKICIRSNNISIVGAQKIIKVLREKFIGLKYLDFSYNRLDKGWWGDSKDFEEELLKLLEKENFEQINLQGNDLATINWHRKMIKKNELSKHKIRIIDKDDLIKNLKDYIINQKEIPKHEIKEMEDNKLIKTLKNYLQYYESQL